jgi:hypothetical protein
MRRGAASKTTGVNAQTRDPVVMTTRSPSAGAHVPSVTVSGQLDSWVS